MELNDAERTSIEQKWGEALKELNPNRPCLTAKELIEVAERGDRARNYERHVQHLVLCRVCREAIREMSEADQVRRLASTSPKIWSWLTWPRIAFAIPAAAAIAVCAMLLANSGWFGGVRSEGPIASNGGEPKTRQQPGPLPNGRNHNDGTRIVQDGPKKDVPGPGDYTSPKPRIRSTLIASNWSITNGRHIYNGVEMPDEIQEIAKSLTSGPAVVRGAATGALRQRPSESGENVVSNWLDQPIEGNTAVVDAKPTFRLAPDDAQSRSARLYEVRDSGDRAELPNALLVTGGSKPRSPFSVALEKEHSLRPGREYVLEVAAKTSEVIAGTPVESERKTSWRFRILSERARRTYTWAKSNEGSLPVAAALTFHRLGQFGDAERVAAELEKRATRTRPGQRLPIEASPIWQKWRSAIHRAYERRVANPDE